MNNFVIDLDEMNLPKVVISGGGAPYAIVIYEPTDIVVFRVKEGTPIRFTADIGGKKQRIGGTIASFHWVDGSGIRMRVTVP